MMTSTHPGYVSRNNLKHWEYQLQCQGIQFLRLPKPAPPIEQRQQWLEAYVLSKKGDPNPLYRKSGIWGCKARTPSKGANVSQGIATDQQTPQPRQSWKTLRTTRIKRLLIGSFSSISMQSPGSFMIHTLGNWDGMKLCNTLLLLEYCFQELVNKESPNQWQLHPRLLPRKRNPLHNWHLNGCNPKDFFRKTDYQLTN